MSDNFNNIYKDKTILITGDTGFKGSWLAIWLVHLGANVIGYSLPPRTEKDNYVICGLDKKITHINGDIRDYNSLLEVFSKYNPDIVFHLAAQPLVLDSYDNPVNTFQTNIMGTVNILETIRQTQSVRAAIIVTSDKCYDNKEWIYGYREIDPMGGKDPYSASKGACEIVTSSYICSFFNKEKSPSIATVRAGNVIGGGDWSPNRILPDCIKALCENKPIVMRNPDAIRPWQHVLEPLYGYLLLGSYLFMYGKKYSGPWNFGPLTMNIVSVKQLVKEMIKQWGNGNCIIEQGHKHQESQMLYLDISKAINKLNWYPVFNFKQTIRWAIEEYKVDDYTAEEAFNQRIDHIQKYIELRQIRGE